MTHYYYLINKNGRQTLKKVVTRVSTGPLGGMEAAGRIGTDGSICTLPLVVGMGQLPLILWHFPLQVEGGEQVAH
jgi:hypothetical protein